VKKFALAGLALAIALGLAGCAPAAEAGPTPSPTESGNGIDPSLIPAQATSDLPMVDATQYLTDEKDFVFKIGDGPTWCSINQESKFVICEQDEAATLYDPVEMPDTCTYSYGFQVRLSASKPAKNDTAEFTCAGGYYADPTKAKPLEDGYAIRVDDFTCYTAGQTARCDNAIGNYIVLGANVWALGN
jgi:hypothetical protein